MKAQTVSPKYFEGWNMSLFQIIGMGPKYSICCGNCNLNFSSRIDMVDNPPARCPYCGVINILPLKT